ncbi:MAG: SMC-Scp complex subunit ScpB [Eggerthellaceae bacterium]|nr:SMC-Scp complex subunit ScpB [Eggerthellaceae bacterium]
MFQGITEADLPGAMEALLFVTDQPVSAVTLAEMLECDASLAESALLALQEQLASGNRGIQLREVAGGWRLFTHPAYHELIEKYVVSWDTRKLSAAAMETLAIVAYSQPCTRGQVASVRGVNSDSPMNSLVEKGLLREVGVADAPGNPVLYGTTRTFLEKFGLRTVADLPDLAQFVPDEETRRLVAERLSAVRVQMEAVEGEEKPAAPVASEADADNEGEQATAPGPVEDAARAAMAAAFSALSGAVEKIDFDTLVFETDDE